MALVIIEVNNVNRFLEEEVPKSIGLVCPPGKIRKHFDIEPKNGIWRGRKEKQKKG